jgi:hypothetical protein
VDLLALVAPLEPALNSLQCGLDKLTSDAVEIRYPGRSATKAEAKTSLATARQVRAVIRAGLGLPV